MSAAVPGEDPPPETSKQQPGTAAMRAPLRDKQSFLNNNYHEGTNGFGDTRVDAKSEVEMDVVAQQAGRAAHH